MEKHAYAVVRALKNLKLYVLHSYSVVHIPYPEVKIILTQQEIGCNTRGAWIEEVQEYDIELKPTKLVQGNGLCKIIAENQEPSPEEETSRVLMVILGLQILLISLPTENALMD